MWSLYLGNLSSNVKHRELENAFRRFGNSKLELKDGYGFIIYDERGDAAQALKALQGRSICGEQPSIRWAYTHRPFQRLSGKRNYFQKGSREKIDNKSSSRKPSFHCDRLSEDEKRKNEFLLEGKNVLSSGEDVDRSIPREGSKDHRSLLNGGTNGADGFDAGRWDPHTGMSPEHVILAGVRQQEGHPLFDRENVLHQENHNGYAHHKKGQDLPNGIPQERGYNCGHYGHIQRQCRLRGRNNYLQRRGAGGFDGRTNEPRHFHIHGSGYIRAKAGRLRGVNGFGKVFTNNIAGKRWRFKANEAKSPTKSRHRHGSSRSESPKDYSNAERNNKKDRKSQSRSDTSSRKRKRSPDSSSTSDTSSSSSESKSSSKSQSVTSSTSRSKPCSSNSSDSKKLQSPATRPHSPSLSIAANHDSHSAGVDVQSLDPNGVDSQSLKSKTCSNSSDSKKLESPATRSRSPSLSIAANNDFNSAGVDVLSLEPNGVDSQSLKSSGVDNQSLKPDGLDSKSLKPNVIDRKSIKPNNIGCSPTCSNSKAGLKSQKHEKLASMLNDKSFKVTEDKTPEKGSSKCSSERKDDDQNSAKRKESSLQSSRQTKKLCQMKKTMSECEIPDPGKSVHSTTEMEAPDNRNLLGLSIELLESKNSIYMALMKEVPSIGGCIDDQKVSMVYGAARLWSWESILYRRLQRGLISVENYDRRRKQNEEFGIKDKFIRSSCGWFEKPCD